MPNVRKVNSLKRNDGFLMHGVVLQNRVFRPRASMFHVKHSCVKWNAGALRAARCFT